MSKIRKTSIRKRICSVLLTGTMTAVLLGSTGCGDGENKIPTAGSGIENDGKEMTQETDKAMGRYVETVNTTLENVVHAGAKIQETDDGSLVVFDKNEGMFVSKDGGETWEKKSLAWYEELIGTQAYVMSIAVSKDGYVGVVYSENTQDDFSLSPKCVIGAPDGSYIDVEIPYEEDQYLENMQFSDDGRLFAAALGGKVYEIDKTAGSYELVTELTDWVFSMAIHDNIMLCENTQGITVFDLEKREIVEDKALDDFIGSEFGDRLEFVNMTAVPILMLPEADNILYMVCEKGIYRHVIGGSMMEQLTDGELTSLNDPANQILDGMMLEDGAFRILFWSGKMINYTYNPDTPTLPDIQLKAYSLEENYTLKRVISDYQSKHPEVYIKYETGISGESSITKEDALKRLNTEIAAGNGPDIMIMDNMPVESYISKGILMDLSPYLEKLEKEKYFTNVTNSFKSDAGTFVVPVGFAIPLFVGESSTLAQIKTLNDLAEMMELCREENEDGNLLGVMSEQALFAKLMPISMQKWREDKGKLNEEALAEFFESSKRIWDAENIGITEQMKAEYEKMISEMNVSIGWSESDRAEYFAEIGISIMDYVGGKQEFILGSLNDSITFDTLISSFKTKDRTTGDYSAFGENGVFLPATIVGISQTSMHPEIAGELFVKMLEGEMTGDGFPVNKEEWREQLLINATEDGGSYGSMMISDEDNYTISLNMYPASQQDIDKLMQMADAATVPYIRDSVIENAVYETGKQVLAGELTPEKGAEEVINKVAIYMAE